MKGEGQVKAMGNILGKNLLTYTLFDFIVIRCCPVQCVLKAATLVSARLFWKEKTFAAMIVIDAQKIQFHLRWVYSSVQFVLEYWLPPTH